MMEPAALPEEAPWTILILIEENLSNFFLLDLILYRLTLSMLS